MRKRINEVVKKVNCKIMGNYVEIYNNFPKYFEELNLNTYYERGMEGEIKWIDILLKVIQDKEIILKKKNKKAWTQNQINKIYDDCVKLDLDCSVLLDDTVIMISKTFFKIDDKLNYNPIEPEIEEI
jgi:hypothetical protein|uniref:Uncharacterized protein n=1 Tax=Myoviridae sp. ctkfK18 TaxID=2825165 RepID=A0A8S5VH35_9CAUD|nr:MAG TPA: hypothetical protein [Myoviridae sp. ctkfK18]